MELELVEDTASVYNTLFYLEKEVSQLRLQLSQHLATTILRAVSDDFLISKMAMIDSWGVNLAAIHMYLTAVRDKKTKG